METNRHADTEQSSQKALPWSSMWRCTSLTHTHTRVRAQNSQKCAARSERAKWTLTHSLPWQLSRQCKHLDQYSSRCILDINRRSAPTSKMRRSIFLFGWLRAEVHPSPLSQHLAKQMSAGIGFLPPVALLPRSGHSSQTDFWTKRNSGCKFSAKSAG